MSDRPVGSAIPLESAGGNWLGFLRERTGGRRVHFVGVGGVGQNALARILLEAGVPVSGSDLHASETLDDLARLGGAMRVGHAAENAAGAGLVVVSTAVPANNPEIELARAEGVPIIKRAELMGLLTRERVSVCVAGTHGKTTTSAMVTMILLQAGLDPTVMVGGTVPALGTGGRFGRGPHFVTETDEFDASFLRFFPSAAIITSVEPDHLDFYGTFEAIVEAFTVFVGRLPSDGVLVACADDPVVRRLAEGAPCTVRSYGLEFGEWRATDIRANDLGGNDLTATRAEVEYARLRLTLPGRHNVANALAAVAVSDWCGAGPDDCVEALRTFSGVRRRFELKGEVGGIAIYDDYGHHPTEIRATLAAARERAPKRLICLFQPHTVHRTRSLFDEFATAFGDADVALLADIYVPAGREVPSTDVTSATLLRAMRHPHAEHVGGLDASVVRLTELARPGDVIVTMGAGDVNSVGDRLLLALRARGSSGDGA